MDRGISVPSQVGICFKKIFNDKNNVTVRYRRHCYTSYVTAFNPVQEEECSDNYKKNCFIEYGIDAINQTVRICK